jgi:hypothetical protein
MAGFTAECGAICPHLLHSLFKLTLMRILVTGSTGAIVEMV